ncbi:MAG: aconitate hydratase [Elusimicrobiota bacterium]
MNIVEKILAAHIVEGELAGEKEIGIRIDQTLTQDATGTMAYLEFEAIGIDSVKTELSVSYIDHNTLQDGFENADDHRYLQNAAEKYGLFFSKAGNGICHQVHLESFAVPGKTLLGSDSHTPTAGGIGSLAIGAGGLDIASAMAGSPFYLPAPKTLNINLTGKLRPFVSAKDIILKILEILTTRDNVGYIVEYSGDGLKGLSVPERATIANMGAELGVTTSVFPSDNVTLRFMRSQGRESDWIELAADKDAIYEKEMTLDLSLLNPMIALPHSPDNVKEVKELKGLKVDQVLIGSCTNASYKDLYTVAKLLENRQADKNVSFGVSPGSKQVFEMLADNGLIKNIVEAGARILESSCGFCIGMGQSPGTDAVSLRTNNRNFLGRSGTKSAGIYLVSPETAVASALAGEITDPGEYFKDTVEFSMPEKFKKNDSLLIPPLKEKDREKVTLFKGPNIGSPPVSEALDDTLKAIAVLKVGDKITTDHIMPAGRYLKYRSNIERYSDVVFLNVDEEFAEKCRRNRKNGFSNIIVGGYSYGQGSSRKHAAICPMYLGVSAVIVKSIERIHRANLINFGIVPLLFENEDDYSGIDPGDELVLADIADCIKKNLNIKVENKTKGREYTVKGSFSERERYYLLAGGKLNVLKSV